MPLTLASFAGGGQQGGPFTTIVSAAQNVANGNSLVVGGRWIATGCTDNAGNTYIPLGHLVGNPTSNLGEGHSFFYCNNCIGNAALVCTIALASTSFGLDTYTYIGAWNIAGGPLVPSQYSMSVGSGTVMTFVPYPTPYPNSITCLLGGSTANLNTCTVNAPLTQDGGSSLGGQQIAAASHVIYTNQQQQSAQPLVSTTSVNGTWQIGGPVFGTPPAALPTKKRVERFGPATFTGRQYSYDIALERLV